ncbi:MAG: ATP-binding cassette domain-containing protein [Lachnospiraceae bacterium]|nr:ATP-binding cassette domain-containing protein [Lachnospiraceae bacterium]
METAVKVLHLKKYFKEVKAVDNINFQIQRGELFGFLGINGAGKSTTINMLCTLFPPTDGQVEICGYRLGKDNEKIRRSIGVVCQNNSLDNRLSVKENLVIRGKLYEKDSNKLKRKLDDVCEIMSLKELVDRRYAKLSGGQKRRCEIAAALLHTPEILFLDEPTTGLDPATRKLVWESVEQLREELNMTVFLTTHYMEEAARATSIAIIDAGHLKEQGTPFDLKERYAKDKLRLVAAAGKEQKLIQMLEQKQLSYYVKESDIILTVDNSICALPVLEMCREVLDGFEMLQGTMDDVFLNVTGRTLENRES